MISCDKLIQKWGEFKKILTPLTESLALLGTSVIETNHLRQDLVNHKLPTNLKLLAKDAFSGSDFLFGDEINKRISQFSAANSALQKPNN